MNPSVVKSTRPPESGAIVLVLDETLSGPSIICPLMGLNIPVKPLMAVLPRGSTDESIMAAMSGLPGHFFLTRDRDFRYKPSVARELREGGVGAFVITAVGNKTAGQIVEVIRLAWPRIQRFAERNKRPFVVRVDTAGVLHSASG